MFGLARNDQMSGLGGDDTVHGGAGNDFLEGCAGFNELHGDAGNDTLSLRNSDFGGTANGGAVTSDGGRVEVSFADFGPATGRLTAADFLFG